MPCSSMRARRASRFWNAGSMFSLENVVAYSRFDGSWTMAVIDPGALVLSNFGSEKV